MYYCTTRKKVQTRKRARIQGVVCRRKPSKTKILLGLVVIFLCTETSLHERYFTYGNYVEILQIDDENNATIPMQLNSEHFFATNITDAKSS